MSTSVPVFEVHWFAHEYSLILLREMRWRAVTLGTGWVSITDVLTNLPMKIVVYVFKNISVFIHGKIKYGVFFCSWNIVHYEMMIAE